MRSAKPILSRRQFTGALSSVGIASSLGLPLPARAQTAWPQRPVKWIVSQPAGAGPDLLARFLGEALSKSWGQAVVVENRPGGQNVIGAQAAARSAPDGYTFFYATTAAMVTNLYTFKTLAYDPVKDFVPVRLVGRSPFVIATGATSGIGSLPDALAQARAKPGQVAIANEGPKTFSGMLAGSFAVNANVQLNSVAYTKATDAIQDVIAGRVALVCLPEAALISYIKSNQLKALAVSSAQRVPALPGVPALSESMSGFEFTGWNGLFAPAGTPDDVVQRVSRDVEVLLKQPEIAQRFESMGSFPETSMNPAGFASFMQQERDRWARVVKAIGLVAE